MSTKAKRHVAHECNAIVISCMDFRLRKYLRAWASSTLDTGGYDRVAIAGGVKNLGVIVDQVSLSAQLHNINEVYLINHEDCGAYGAEGSFEKHKEDLLFAQTIIEQKFPDMKIIPLYLKLNGEFIRVNEK